MNILIALLVIVIIINLFVFISLGILLYRSIILERDRRRVMREEYYSPEQIELRRRF